MSPRRKGGNIHANIFKNPPDSSGGFLFLQGIITQSGLRRMSIPEYTMQSSFKKNFFSYSYLFGLFLLVGSLPYSKFLISLSEIILLLSWLCDGNLAEKIRLFSKNKIALVISSLFILHLIGLLYTSDFKYGLEDVKKKIPLFLLPLIFSSSAPLSKQMFEKALAVFVISVTVATFICLYVLLGYTQKDILHPQQASIFMSHIRFGLLISLSVFILGYFAIEKKSLIFKIIIPLLIGWLIIFLIMMESATGLVCTIVVAAILFIKLILKTRNVPLKVALLTLFIVGLISAANIFYSAVSKFENAPLSSSKHLLSIT